MAPYVSIDAFQKETPAELPQAWSGACLVLFAVAAAGGLWYLHKPRPFPYSQRWMLDKELPFLTRERLCEVLAPRPGERILEIGPGTGLFSVPVARRLVPGGTLDVFDVQQLMLDHTLRVGAANKVRNIVATRGDVRRLPYPESTFDGALMMSVLSEITNHEAALGELRRVLKPGGRLMVGEFLFDWHAVPFGSLRRRAERQGLRFESRLGPPFSYIAHFLVPIRGHASENNNRKGSGKERRTGCHL
jgi:ubiquinone/menaquinone biosynthesis C-methylase UbiE